MFKTYSELISLKTYKERLLYLQCKSFIGEKTFGSHRYLNQKFYESYDWQKIRRKIIIRDNGCDLAIEDLPINGRILIHHINPVTIEDIIERKDCVFDLENLVCVAFDTHNAIHFGEVIEKKKEFETRTKNDTCPWK